MSKCEHARKYPCSQCTNRLLHLLQARVQGTNLWQCDIDAIRSAVRGHPDFTVCVHCGKGSTAYEAERCSCKGGKTTLVHVAESRTDSGAQWQDEDVVDSKGRLFKGSDPSWQRNCPFGASKESLMMLNLIKSAARQ